MVEHDVIAEDKQTNLSKSNSFVADKPAKAPSIAQQTLNDLADNIHLGAESARIDADTGRESGALANMVGDLKKFRVLFFKASDRILNVVRSGGWYDQGFYKCLKAMSAWSVVPLGDNVPANWKALAMKTYGALTQARLAYANSAGAACFDYMSAATKSLGTETINKVLDTYSQNVYGKCPVAGDVSDTLFNKLQAIMGVLSGKRESEISQAMKSHNKEVADLVASNPGKEWSRLVDGQIAGWGEVFERCVKEISSLGRQQSGDRLEGTEDGKGGLKMPGKHRREFDALYEKINSEFKALAQQQSAEWEALATKIDSRGVLGKLGTKVRDLF